MSSKSLWVGLLVLGAACSAHAETAAECQQRLDSAVQCYVSRAATAIKICALKIEDSMQLGRNDLSCIAKTRESVDLYYAAAAKTVAKNRKAATLLNETHSYWLSTLSGLTPTATESPKGYAQRQQDREGGFDERSSKLLQEK